MELASVFYLTGTINESEFFSGRHLGIISILPLNCSRYLPSGHSVNWARAGAGLVHHSASGSLTHQLWSLSPDIQARQAHPRRAFSWGLSSWITFDSGTHPRERSPGTWGLEISDGHWIFGTSLKVESGDKSSVLLGLEGNRKVGNWPETPDPEKTQMALTGRKHRPALWFLSWQSVWTWGRLAACRGCVSEGQAETEGGGSILGTGVWQRGDGLLVPLFTWKWIRSY